MTIGSHEGIDMVEDVLSFHRTFGCHVGNRPGTPSPPLVKLRLALIGEEFRELLRAVDRQSIPDVADAIVDLIYVSIGTAIAYGIDIRPIWRAVQKANMAKAGGGRRADGKILKPAGWQAPDVTGLIEELKQRATTNGGSIWKPETQAM
jgi:predicted HAD superfamily Cof-like phosphohydrolase